MTYYKEEVEKLEAKIEACLVPEKRSSASSGEKEKLREELASVKATMDELKQQNDELKQQLAGGITMLGQRLGARSSGSTTPKPLEGKKSPATGSWVKPDGESVDSHGWSRPNSIYGTLDELQMVVADVEDGNVRKKVVNFLLQAKNAESKAKLLEFMKGAHSVVLETGKFVDALLKIEKFIQECSSLS